MFHVLQVQVGFELCEQHQECCDTNPVLGSCRGFGVGLDFFFSKPPSHLEFRKAVNIPRYVSGPFLWLRSILGRTVGGAGAVGKEGAGTEAAEHPWAALLGTQEGRDSPGCSSHPRTRQKLNICTV